MSGEETNKNGGADVAMMHLDMFQGAKKAEISPFPLVWKRCQRRTVMASCFPVTGGEKGS